jgi:hypothetical protein
MLPSVGFLLGLLFSPEDGGNMFLKNVKILCKLHSITTQKTMLFIELPLTAINLCTSWKCKTAHQPLHNVILTHSLHTSK